MGWSCRAEVGDTLDRMSAKCVAMTGMSNAFIAGGKRRFYELSRREYDDGHASGQIYEFLPDDMCKRVGSFYINPDGSPRRMPKELRDVKCQPALSRSAWLSAPTYYSGR